MPVPVGLPELVVNEIFKIERLYNLDWPEPEFSIFKSAVPNCLLPRLKVFLNLILRFLAPRINKKHCFEEVNYFFRVILSDLKNILLSHSSASPLSLSAKVEKDWPLDYDFKFVTEKIIVTVFSM